MTGQWLSDLGDILHFSIELSHFSVVCVSPQ